MISAALPTVEELAVPKKYYTLYWWKEHPCGVWRVHRMITHKDFEDIFDGTIRTRTEDNWNEWQFAHEHEVKA